MISKTSYCLSLLHTQVPRVGVVENEFPPASKGISFMSPSQRNLVKELLLDDALLMKYHVGDASGGAVYTLLAGVSLLHQSTYKIQNRGVATLSLSW